MLYQISKYFPKIKEKYYFDDNLLKIINIENNKIISESFSKKGYIKLNLIDVNNKINSFLLHRIVAILCIPNPENKPQVNHKNGIKTDNKIENLEWCTNLENRIHANNMGLLNSKTHKLSDNQVREICSSKLNYIQLSKKYNIPSDLIGKIKRRVSYKYITNTLEIEQNNTIKLTELQRKEIMKSKEKTKDLMKKYNISRPWVKALRRKARKTYLTVL